MSSDSCITLMILSILRILSTSHASFEVEDLEELVTHSFLCGNLEHAPLKLFINTINHLKKYFYRQCNRRKSTLPDVRAFEAASMAILSQKHVQVFCDAYPGENLIIAAMNVMAVLR